MKRLILLICALIVAASMCDVSAQQLVKKRIGTYREDGNVVVAEATTTLAVDVEVERVKVEVGPYARYAQRLLGQRAALVEREDYYLLSANVSVLGDDATAEVSTSEAEISSDLGGVLPVDRLSSAELSTEAAAEAAADQLFLLRRARLDLITGELGDGVFGGGLEAAIQEIARLEQAYLELFFGRRTVEIIKERIVVPVDALSPNSIIARFSSAEGMLAVDDITGDIVMLNIAPSNMSYPQSDERGTVAYRYANNAVVTVSLARDIISTQVLPIYEFGATVMYANPR